MQPEFKELLFIKDSHQRFKASLELVYQKYKPAHCFIAQFVEHNTLAKTICYLRNGIEVDNFSYLLKGSPCEQARLSSKLCFYPDQIQHTFPEDIALQEMSVDGYLGTVLISHHKDAIGVLVCLFDDPVKHLNIDQQWFDGLAYFVGEELYHATEIKEKNKILKQLQLSNVVFEHASEAIIVSDKNNIIVAVNPAAESTTGYSKAELIGQDPKILSSGRHDAAFYQQMWQAISTNNQWIGEISNQKKDGTIYSEQLSLNAIKDDNDNISHYIAIFYDISQIKENKRKLEFYAARDTLTKLSNRRYFIEQLDSYLITQRGGMFGLLAIDIDDFRTINDIYGHQVADSLLITLAEKLQMMTSNIDQLCRYGGDEFIVLVPCENVNEFKQYANKLSNLLNQQYQIGEIIIDATVKISGAIYPDNGLTSKALLQSLFFALRNIKQHTDQLIGYHDDNSQQIFFEQVFIRNYLKKAIKNKLFQVHYQPIINCKLNKIEKFEALVRLPGADGNYISPGQFIPVAEQSGLITKIGELVLEQTCQDLKKLRELGFNDISISVNRSINEFHHSQEGESISRTIASHGVPYDAIVVEITESVAMSANKHTQTVLASLKKHGVKIALDDFGTGFSSLSNLVQYKSDILKIDRSFIANLVADKEQQTVTSSIITLAKNLGMTVIAEGVEDSEQLALLKQYDCQLIQGWYYSPAKPIEHCIEMLEQGELNWHNPK